MVGFWRWLLGLGPEPEQPPEAPTLREQLEQARLEWQEAEAYFNSVTDPALVDHAIYNLEAAKRKYAYLLQQFRLQENQ